MSQFRGRMRRVGRYGPRCSIRFEDRWAEMLAEDYISPMFGRLWPQMRNGYLRTMLAPNLYARSFLSKSEARESGGEAR